MKSAAWKRKLVRPVGTLAPFWYLETKPKTALPAWVWVLSAGLIVAVYLLFLRPIWGTVGVDWKANYLPAFQAAAHGSNPYLIHYKPNQGFLNPPWTLLLVAPFAALPQELGLFLYFVFTLLSFVAVAWKLGAKPVALFAFLLSPPVIQGVYYLNLEIWVLWGFVLPPPIGMLLVLVKPQMGVVFAVFLLVEAWRQGGWRRALWTALPTLSALGISFVLYGNWIWSALVRNPTILNYDFNHSLGSMGWGVGAIMVIWALLGRHRPSAMGASVVLSPYSTLPSWTALMVAFLRSDKWMVAIFVISTIEVLLRRGL